MCRGVKILWVGVQNAKDRRVKIPWVEGLICHGNEVQYAIGMGFNILWIWGRYTMGRGFNIPWMGGSIYHG